MDISLSAIHQLESILYTISNKIIDTTKKIQQKTDFETLCITIDILFKNDLGTHMIKNGQSGSLLFSTSSFHTLLIGTVKGNLKRSTYLLTGAIEYLCNEILQVAELHAISNNRNKITVFDLVRGIQRDKDLYHVYKISKLCLLENFGVHVLPYHPFHKLVKELLERVSEEKIKISKSAIKSLQLYIEKRLTTILGHAKDIRDYTGQSKLTGEDIDFVYTRLCK